MDQKLERSARQISKLFTTAGDDVVLLVLKGHLLIEERLNEILVSYVAQPSVFKQANLRYHHLCIFCEALFQSADRAWVWESIRHLNTLRNDLAHKLDSTTREQLIENFLKPIEQTQRAIGLELEGGKAFAERLRSTLAFLLGVLENYPPDPPG